MSLLQQVPFFWQESAWRRLMEDRGADRLSHALLFHGPAGLGKSLLAERFAWSLLCHQPDESGQPCGHCRACQLLAAGTHADFQRVAPEEEKRNIQIDAIRVLQQQSTLAVEEGKHRLFLIDPAEAMTMAAANALLKTLEEPPAGVHLLLVSSHPERLPITIRSRCQQVALRPPSGTDAARWLERQVGLSSEQLELLLAIAGGAPLTALRLADSEERNRWRQFLDDFTALSQGRGSASGVAESWLESSSLENLLQMLTTWLLALLRLSMSGDTSHPLAHLLASAGMASPAPMALHRLLDKLLESQRRLNRNPNPQMVLESLLIEWQRVSGR